MHNDSEKMSKNTKNVQYIQNIVRSDQQYVER